MPCLIVGSGPAALLAADILSSRQIPVKLFERRPAPGWKLLVAGSSGLNVTHSGEMGPEYTARRAEVSGCLQKFGREEWLSYLHGLGEETFLGTSRRFFLKNKKASSLLAAWVKRLRGQGVEFHFGEELVDFLPGSSVELRFASGRTEKGEAALLALGGGSWEDQPPGWPEAFISKGIAFSPFAPANAGYSFRAPAGFFEAAEGKPVKGLTLKTTKGEKTGECMITRYGLEGTPVYTMGCPGPATIDLKPDITLERLASRLSGGLRHAKLSPGAELLFLALASDPNAKGADLARQLKALPIELLEPRPLSESISSSGGISWDELSPELELKKAPGIYCAGEMVDWDAPTGGFLLQACVSMGAVAAEAIQKRILS
jgi:uncharacterized flavoprotein (TIGR03862 family)